MIPVYIEIGTKRVFADAISWPGWCRSARAEGEALATLLAYGERYAKATASSDVRFVPPASVDEFEVQERLQGGSGTDFGAPSVEPTADREALHGEELEQRIAILEAIWSNFDAVARAAAGIELRKGPRGGGRDLDKIQAHVAEADEAYFRELGGKIGRGAGRSPLAAANTTRTEAIHLLRSRAHGEEPATGPRRTRPFWSPRFYIRHAAWHALDHTWEIEDRST